VHVLECSRGACEAHSVVQWRCNRSGPPHTPPPHILARCPPCCAMLCCSVLLSSVLTVSCAVLAVLCRLEVVGDRELAFFPGRAAGSIYKGFRYGECRARACCSRHPLKVPLLLELLGASAACHRHLGLPGGVNGRRSLCVGMNFVSS